MVFINKRRYIFKKRFTFLKKIFKTIRLGSQKPLKYALIYIKITLLNKRFYTIIRSVAKWELGGINNEKEYKELQGYKIIFDTASTEPAYPTQMQKENILMYVNKNTIYSYNNDRMQAFPVDEKFEGKISKEIVIENKDKIVQFLSYLILVAAFLVIMFRLIFFTIIALVVALIIGAATKVSLGFKKLLILALYLQGPVLILDLILLILPLHILGMSVFIALLIFIVYLNLIFLNLRSGVTLKTNISINEDEE